MYSITPRSSELSHSLVKFSREIALGTNEYLNHLVQMFLSWQVLKVLVQGMETVFYTAVMFRAINADICAEQCKRLHILVNVYANSCTVRGELYDHS